MSDSLRTMAIGGEGGASAQPVELPEDSLSDSLRTRAIRGEGVASSQPVELPQESSSDSLRTLPNGGEGGASAHPVELPQDSLSDSLRTVPIRGEGGASGQPVELPQDSLSDSLRTMPIGGGRGAAGQLVELPEDALISIFHKLDPESLVMVARCAKKPQQVVEDDLVWMELCRQWENSVDLDIWRAQMVSGKALYRLLRFLSRLVGLWSHRSDNPRGELVYVTWGVCALEGWRVIAGTGAFDEEVKFGKFFDVTGKPDGSHEVALFSDKLFSKDVIIPSSQSENEFVLEINGIRRESWRKLYKRLAIGEPTSGQELAGLWIGLYGSHGSEILTVSYSDNFIIGTKIIGDINVPSEEITFKADTRTVSSDFPDFLEISLPPLAKMYQGHGRIAEVNFQDPTWIPGLLLVEESGNFSFMWQDDLFSIRYYALDLEASFRSKTLVRQHRAAASRAE